MPLPTLHKAMEYFSIARKKFSTTWIFTQCCDSQLSQQFRGFARPKQRLWKITPYIFTWMKTVHYLWWKQKLSEHLDTRFRRHCTLCNQLCVHIISRQMHCRVELRLNVLGPIHTHGKRSRKQNRQKTAVPTYLKNNFFTVLVALFWTFGGICPRFQIQGRSLTCMLHLQILPLLWHLLVSDGKHCNQDFLTCVFVHVQTLVGLEPTIKPAAKCAVQPLEPLVRLVLIIFNVDKLWKIRFW